jgi:FecR protein
MILIGLSSYRYYEAVHADDPVTPEIHVDAGSASVIRGASAYDMQIGESFTLEAWDAIETRASSRATITWPDRSITRMGADSRIVIDRMAVADDYSRIEIAYDMKRGKVWNTVIRSLLGDSYFEARLPKNNIVAWVRGTVFEVNLEWGYIHAVDHAMRLTDISGKALTLLPGELVSSEDIWIARGREILDTAWATWNQVSDERYRSVHIARVKARIDTLAWEIGSYNPLDGFTRWILSHFAKFRIMSVSSLLDATDLSSISW